MYLINERQGSILMGSITHFLKRAHCSCLKKDKINNWIGLLSQVTYIKFETIVKLIQTCHGMDGFKCHNLGNCWIHLLQKCLQMVWVIVFKDVFGNLTVSDTLNHGGMVASIRENLTS